MADVPIKRKPHHALPHERGRLGNLKALVGRRSQEVMEQVAGHREAIINRLLKISTMDEHPGQVAALKVLMDHLPKTTEYLKVMKDEQGDSKVVVNVVVESEKPGITIDAERA